jgi:endonuclease-3
MLRGVTRAEKARRIQAILDELHPAPAIPLRHRDPFTLLVAVVLSAQCTDQRVNQVAPELFAKASTPFEMAELPVEDIVTIIRPCGLAPTKGRNISALSRILVSEHDGSVPDSLEALEALPGVGHKTAAVVRSQALVSVERTERDLKRVFPPEAWGALHLQMIYFGREHCPALGHDLAACPICSWAASRARIEQERRKRGSRRRARPARDAP